MKLYQKISLVIGVGALLIIGGYVIFNWKNQAVTKDNQIYPAKLAKLDINTITVEKFRKTFGEPESYRWGSLQYTKNDDLPLNYFMLYAEGFQVRIKNGQLMEVQISNPSYVVKGLKIGQTLAEVEKIVGAPKEVVNNHAMGFEDGVLYLDIKRLEKGYSYYQRLDQGLRLFFKDDVLYIFSLTNKSVFCQKQTEPLPTKSWQ